LTGPKHWHALGRSNVPGVTLRNGVASVWTTLYSHSALKARISIRANKGVAYVRISFWTDKAHLGMRSRMQLVTRMTSQILWYAAHVHHAVLNQLTGAEQTPAVARANVYAYMHLLPFVSGSAPDWLRSIGRDTDSA